jgi:hypothetical protein
LENDGISEMKIDVGQGYRVYFAREGHVVGSMGVENKNGPKGPYSLVSGGETGSLAKRKPFF